MTKSAMYTKTVEWSDEDQSFIGYCPGIIGPCCHGDEEVDVYRDLCRIVDEWLEVAAQENKTPPPSTGGRNVGEVLLANTIPRHAQDFSKAIRRSDRLVVPSISPPWLTGNLRLRKAVLRKMPRPSSSNTNGTTQVYSSISTMKIHWFSWVG